MSRLRALKNCNTCGLPKVDLLNGRKCGDCISAGWKLDRVRRKAAGISTLARAAVRERDGDLCRYCGCSLISGLRAATNNREYDHIIAVRVGGTGATDNIALSCHRCNHRKQGIHTVLLAVYRNALRAETDPAVLAVYASRSLVA